MAIVRLEQLYPLPATQLKAVFEKYPKAQVCWAQEEPSNMGAWQYVHSIFRTLGVDQLTVVARKASASPATGFKKVHDAEQADLVERALSV